METQERNHHHHRQEGATTTTKTKTTIDDAIDHQKVDYCYHTQEQDTFFDETIHDDIVMDDDPLHQLPHPVSPTSVMGFPPLESPIAVDKKTSGTINISNGNFLLYDRLRNHVVNEQQDNDKLVRLLTDNDESSSGSSDDDADVSSSFDNDDDDVGAASSCSLLLLHDWTDNITAGSSSCTTMKEQRKLIKQNDQDSSSSSDSDDSSCSSCSDNDDSSSSVYYWRRIPSRGTSTNEHQKNLRPHYYDDEAKEEEDEARKKKDAQDSSSCSSSSSDEGGSSCRRSVYYWRRIRSTNEHQKTKNEEEEEARKKKVAQDNFLDSSTSSTVSSDEECSSAAVVVVVDDDDDDDDEASVTAKRNREQQWEVQKEEVAVVDAEDDDDELTSSVPIKDLKKHAILGEGQFGQVWLVSSSSSPPPSSSSSKRRQKPRYRALKIQSKYELSEGHQIRNVIREKEIMQRMQYHPFIIRLLQTAQDESFVYILLDFVQGGELFSVMHPREASDDGGDDEIMAPAKKPLPESQVCFYSLCIADALCYMHGKLVVYRDLKPENVLIDSRGYPVLIDFGLAKYLGKNDSNDDKENQAATTTTIYTTHTMCGTPSYMSPEMVSASPKGHGFAADHWALGVLTHEMIAGEHPFVYYEGMSQMDIFTSITEDPYVPPPPSTTATTATTTTTATPKTITVSEGARDFMTRLLIKDPSKRLGSTTTTGRGHRCKEEQEDNEILRHPWLKMYDLRAMRRREIAAPWVPTIEDPADTKCFDDWTYLEDKTELTFPSLPPEEEALFKDF